MSYIGTTLMKYAIPVWIPSRSMTVNLYAECGQNNKNWNFHIFDKLFSFNQRLQIVRVYLYFFVLTFKIKYSSMPNVSARLIFHLLMLQVQGVKVEFLQKPYHLFLKLTVTITNVNCTRNLLLIVCLRITHSINYHFIKFHLGVVRLKEFPLVQTHREINSLMLRNLYIPLWSMNVSES